MRKQTVSWAEGLALLLAAASSFFPALPAAAACATYYVATTGNDGNPGTVDSPWQTIGHAARTLEACDTVLVRGGTYPEAVAVRKSGTAAAPIRFIAYPGEYPVIDGQNSKPGPWGALVHLGGDYLQISGFEVRNSAQFGVHLEGRFNAAQNLNVHHVFLQGIIARGDYSLVEDCRVWQASLENYNGANAATGYWHTGLSAARDPVDGITNGAILRRNTVYYNWGEGLSTFEADGTLIEDNIVFDNWAVNLYVSDTTNALVQRNLVYTFPDSPMGENRCGICLSDETPKNPSANIRVINNLVYGHRRNFGWFAFFANSSMRDVLVAQNTFATGDVANTLPNVILDYGPHSGVRFVNNIIYREGAGDPIQLDPRNFGMGFASNLWSSYPQLEAVGPNDIVADPQLRKSNADPRWFKLDRASPALRAGMTLDEVRDDYFGRPRTETPDIGAHQRSR